MLLEDLIMKATSHFCTSLHWIHTYVVYEYVFLFEKANYVPVPIHHVEYAYLITILPEEHRMLVVLFVFDGRRQLIL